MIPALKCRGGQVGGKVIRILGGNGALQEPHAAIVVVDGIRDGACRVGATQYLADVQGRVGAVAHGATGGIHCLADAR